LFRPRAIWGHALPDQPPEDLGTIAALVLAGLVIVLAVIGAVLIIAY
jgi:hypothetical protein